MRRFHLLWCSSMLISRNILVPFLALMVASGPAFAGASDVEPNDSLVAPEVLDIDDPFRRGLDRIADQATGGVDLPQPSGMTGTQDAVGSELLGLSSDQALFSNRYRVMGVAVSKKEARAQIFSATNQNVLPGNKPQLAYIRLGLFPDESAARQLAIDLKNNIEHLLGAHFIIREEGESGVLLDFGPLRNVTHAERYCEIMLTQSYGLISECYAALEFPGLEPTNTFSSTAMIRPSASAVRDVVKDSDLFDLVSASKKTLVLREGDKLGASGATLVKVTPRGVIVVAENGDVESMPIDFVPERAFSAQDLQTAPAAAPAAPPNLDPDLSAPAGAS